MAVERHAGTIVMGDVRDVADGVSLSKQTNQKISSWNHGQLRKLVAYKAEAEGIALVLQDERYSSQTCPICRARHYEVSLWDKPRGRVYRCPACGTQSHRDVVGQINTRSVSLYLHGAPGHIPPPPLIKHRMPHNLRLMRRCRDTGQVVSPVARPAPRREAAAL